MSTQFLMFWMTKWKVHMKHSVQFSSVTQSCPTVCDPMDCSYARLPCPSTTPGAYSNSCPSSWWCHPIISSSVVPFSSRLQSFPASGSFWMSQFFASVSQRIGVSASASVLPMNIQGWFPVGLVCSPCSPGDSQSNNSSAFSLLCGSTLTSIHEYGKTIALTRRTFVCKVMFLPFKTLSIDLS